MRFPHRWMTSESFVWETDKRILLSHCATQYDIRIHICYPFCSGCRAYVLGMMHKLVLLLTRFRSLYDAKTLWKCDQIRSEVTLCRSQEHMSSVVMKTAIAVTGTIVSVPGVTWLPLPAYRHSMSKQSGGNRVTDVVSWRRDRPVPESLPPGLPPAAVYVTSPTICISRFATLHHIPTVFRLFTRVGYFRRFARPG